MFDALKDIEPMIGFGNYVVDHELIRFDRSIETWINEDNLNLIPEFQRGHVWQMDQQRSFVEFLLKGGKTSPILLNHPSWLGGYRENCEFVCVDGLQRVTAIRLFLCNQLDVFGYHRSEIDNIDTLLRRHSVKLYINNLQTMFEVIKWYLQVNTTGTPHTKEEIKRVQKLLEASKP
jgi:hypothetical protein